ncbi:UDP-3-O-(3-hydroxymyristoyl)-glucosamine N-acyltransferase [Gammaproteobacteria bacterium]|nr:UDP-3-O-(3-hydroxymyristoyl)-glucosamine N-acyltransferase [Gammaproteobacteria bacterium]
MTLYEIIQKLKLKGLSISYKGDENIQITQLSTLQNAAKDGISFLSNSKYRKYLTDSKAGVIVLNLADAEIYAGNVIITDNPHLIWAHISQLFETMPKKPAIIHATALVASTAVIGENVHIGAYAVIEDNVIIGKNTIIGTHCVIESGVSIGADSLLYPRVTICYDCILGERVVLHSGAVIGSQGFGFAKGAAGFVKVAQIGRVILESDVDIGVNSCVDRGAIEDTHIKHGAKIDNLVQIAHNVVIGEHTVIAGCAGVAGSSTIGNHVMIGGATAVGGHIEIVDHAMVTGFTMLSHSLKEPGVYSSGLPVMENKRWHKMTAQLKRIDTLYKRVKVLEKANL